MTTPANNKTNISKSDTKKIAFVSNTSFSLYNFRLGVMKSFIDEGYQVFAIAPPDRYSELFQQESIQYIPITIDCKGTNFLKDIKFYFEISSLYKKHRFDFIFHYTIKPVIYGSLAARRWNIPSIAITTGLGYVFYRTNWLTYLVLFLYKKALTKVKQVWFLNDDDKEVFMQNRVIREDQAFVLRGEGIDTTYFAPVWAEKKDKKFVFLFLSRLVKEKGIEEYVQAARILKEKYPDIECQVLGNVDIDNPGNLSLDKMKEWDREGYIRYLGASIDVRPYIAQCDCVVLPSYYREGVPRCLMEGMSMGRPIITTNNIGCIELIRDQQNGLMCIVKDADHLAEKMEQMYLLEEPVRREWGLNGRSLIQERFDEKIIINTYHQRIAPYLK